MTRHTHDAAAILNAPQNREWEEHWLNRLVERVGQPLVIVGFTLTAMGLSIAITTAGAVLLDWEPEMARAILMPALIAPPMSAWVVRILHMMSQLSRRNQEIATAYRALAMNDQLTGLLNRRGLFDSLMTLDPGQSVILGVADVDRFKQVNDTYGHEIGDQALIKVAEALRALVGDGDILSRSGGDEFVVVMNRKSPIGLPDKLKVTLDGGPTFTVSLGWQRLDPADVDTALRYADAKMYRAKSRRRMAS